MVFITFFLAQLAHPDVVGGRRLPVSFGDFGI
jgi:hypothetical protein